MVKHFTLRRLVLSAALCFSCLLANAYDFEVDGIYYNITDSASLTVEVTFSTADYNSYSGDVTIPETIMYDGTSYSVTSIGEYAFYDCDSLTSVTIPTSVTTIGNMAFYVSIPLANIICLGTTPPTFSSTYIFFTYGTLYVPEGTADTYASASVWKNFDPIVEFTDADSIFFDVDGICYAVLSTGEVMVTWGNYEGDITIPETVTYNSNTYAVTSIGACAFYSCSSLTSVTLPNAVTSIGNNAFRNCSKLTSITIPDAVTSIGSYAFLGSGLKSITIPDAVTSIGDFAFYQCDNLTSVIIPDAVTLGKMAFDRCTRLGDVICLGTTPPAYYSTGYPPFTNLYATLHVPEESSGTYAKESFWMEFSNIVEFTNVDDFFEFEVDGIRYAVLSTDEVKVTGGNYEGDITIPETVTYNSNTYAVTAIGAYALISCDSLTSIALPDSLTSIGSYAFYGCTSLTSIAIPDAVMSIGSYAFYGCTSLTSIAIPDAVMSIGSYAFYECTSLTNVTLPDSLTSIESSVFCGCTGLTSITIPDAVTSIGNYAFSGCMLPDIICLCMTPPTCSNSNAFAYYGTLYVPEGTADTYASASVWKNFDPIVEFTDANSILFDVDGIRYAVLSTDEVKVTGGNYEGDITIPETVTYNSNTYAVTSIGACAFYKCSNLTNIIFPNSVTSIENYAFRGCTGLTSIAIPDAVTSIGSYAFFGSGLKSITIPDAVTSIGSYAFYNCTSLTNVTLPDALTSIESGVFYGCTGLTSISLPDALTSIEGAAFQGCTSLASIVIPDAVTSIGSYAFYGCTSLTSVTLPDSLASIGGYAFYECILPDIICLCITPPACSDAFAYYGTLYVPEGTADTYASASVWKNFDPIVEFTDANSILFDVDGICYAVLSTDEVKVTGGNYEGDITIPETVTYNSNTYAVTSIGTLAFCECSNLTSIIIPNSVTSIGNYAFRGCTGLTSIAIPDPVTSIGNYAFYGCTGLTSITIPDAVTSIGSYAFRGCTSLTNVTLPDALTSIESGVFRGCTGLTSITIPDAVTSIGSYAFYNCTSLTNVTLPDALTSIESDVFYGCTGLTSISLPDALTSIEGAAFQGCTSLASIVIPDAVTSIGSYAFYGCTSLTSVTLPDSLASIESSVFRGCTGLTSITIPDAVTSIGSNAFYSCTSLTNVTLPDALTSIGSSAFYGCTGLTSITIPDAVTSIRNYAFRGCTSLADIYSLNTTPPTCATTSCFSNYDATLHVPTDAVDTYAAVDVWKEFNTIVGDAETAGISTVNVDNSNYQVSADGGMVNVTGLGNGERVTVYTADGRMVGAMTADGGSASISAPKGVAIVRVGNKTLKVAVH